LAGYYGAGLDQFDNAVHVVERVPLSAQLRGDFLLRIVE